MDDGLIRGLQLLERAKRRSVLEEVARLIGAFPVGHSIRQYAEGCPILTSQMEDVRPLDSEDAAIKKVLDRALGGGSHTDGEPNAADIADRIRTVLRPPRTAVPPAPRMVRRRVVPPPSRQRRPVRERGSY